MQRVSIYWPQRGRAWRLWMFAEQALWLAAQLSVTTSRPPSYVLASWMAKKGVRDATH